MSFKTSLASALMTLGLAGTLAMPTYAQQPTDYAAQGSVVTMTDKTMVVRVKKDKDMTLAITADTEKTGDISTGNYVKVHYRNDKGQHVATSIQQSAAPQA